MGPPGSCEPGPHAPADAPRMPPPEGAATPQGLQGHAVPAVLGAGGAPRGARPVTLPRDRGSQRDCKRREGKVTRSERDGPLRVLPPDGCGSVRRPWVQGWGGLTKDSVLVTRAAGGAAGGARKGRAEGGRFLFICPLSWLISASIWVITCYSASFLSLIQGGEKTPQNLCGGRRLRLRSCSLQGGRGLFKVAPTAVPGEQPGPSPPRGALWKPGLGSLRTVWSQTQAGRWVGPRAGILRRQG